MRLSQNNEAFSAPTQKASEQITDPTPTLNSAGSRRQDVGEGSPGDGGPVGNSLPPYTETPFLARALPLAALGLEVFPIDARGKEPVALGFPNKRGKPARLAFSKHATNRPEVIIAKWGGPKFAECNVGVCFREANYGVDIDSLAECEEILDRSLDLSQGARVNTSTTDKFHLYFDGALPEWFWTRGAKYKNANGEEHELFSMRCDVRYLVGPGSIHPSGAVYQWADGVPDRLPPTNENLLRQLQEISEKLGKTASRPEPPKDPLPPEKFDKVLDIMRDNFERLEMPAYEERNAHHGGTNFVFDECVIEPHTEGDNTAQIGVRPDGVLTFHCFHGSHDLKWSEARPLIEARYGKTFEFGDFYKGPTPGIGGQNDKSARADHEDTNNKSPRTDHEEIFIAGNWLNAAVEKSEAALVRERDLNYYRRGQDLVRPVSFDAQQQVSGISRGPGSTVIQLATDETILRDLAKCGRFTKPTRKGEARTPTNPPRELAKHIKDRVASGQAPYRALDMVATSPCLLPDETVLDTAGYRERVLFVPGHTYPRVKDNPTREDAKAELRKLDCLYCKFPFVGREGQDWNQTAAYSALLASFLSILARPALPTVPLTAVDAVTAGTGKTKAVESVCIAALGHTPTSVSFHSDEEFSKVLVPLLREGDRATLIDNISIPLHGDMLCSVLSSKEHRARVLGASEQVRLLNKGVFFATGNNIAIQGDLTRRVMVVALDANVERPEERRFDFEPVHLARQMHPELAVAGLTALRAYILAGKPWNASRPLLGSFEAWDRLIAGCLIWCGYADPVETKNRAIEGDPQREADAELLETWRALYKDRVVSVSDVMANHSMTVNPVRDLLVMEGGDPRSIGLRLARLKGKIFGRLKIVSVRTNEKRGWRVVEIPAR